VVPLVLLEPSKLKQQDGILRVLPMFVDLTGQFDDPVANMLLRCDRCGPCRVARFRHGGVVRLLS
jgi:hypothetical protein